MQNKVMRLETGFTKCKYSKCEKPHRVCIVHATVAILHLISTFQSAGVFEPEINNPFDVGVSEEMKVLEKVETCYRHLD